MKKLFIVLICLILNFTANSQVVKDIINRTSIGYASFKRNSEKGLYMGNETIFQINKYFNPGIKVAFATGYEDRETPFGYVTYCNSILLNGYLNILDKKQKLQLSGGIGLLIFFYNDILRSYDNINPNRPVYDVCTTGQIQKGFGYQIDYAYQVSPKFYLGIQAYKQFSKNNYLMTSVSISIGFKIGS